jgi:hypothetical protein
MTDFGLDDWNYCTFILSHNSGLRAIQRYRYFTHFPFHRCTRRLHQSCFGNGVTTVSLSLQITHGVFFSQSNSFLVIILQLQIPKTQFNYSRLLFSTLLYYFLSARTPWKTPSFMILFTAPFPSNGCPSDCRLRVCCWNVFTDSLPSSGCTYHNMNESR